VTVDLAAPDLVAALASPLPTQAKGVLVRAALARQDANLLDLRDAQQGIVRHQCTDKHRAGYEERNQRAQDEVERVYGPASEVAQC
jgi:hypothetical protein